MNGQTRTDKYFRIAKIFLTLTPILCLVYMTAFGGARGLSVTELIRSEPAMAVAFLTAMLNPFAAYLLGYAQRKAETGDYAYAAANVMSLIAIELILMNLVYAVMLAALLVCLRKDRGLSLGGIMKQYRFKHLLYDISGSLVMLPVAGLCLFAQLRLIIK